MKRVAVIGGTGMVASRFCDLAKSVFEIAPLDEHTVDITNVESIKSYFGKNKFDVIINFAAITNVDAAEKDKGNEDGIVYRLNVLGPRNLAQYCNENNIFLIHISTDFVFPGTEELPGPYNEDDVLPETPNGIGWYGWTKNRAEAAIRSTSNKYAIIRYGYPFRAAPFVTKGDWGRNLINLYNEHKLYPLFNDQVQNILFIDDLVMPLSKIINGELTGVFHIASSDTTTPFESGKYLLEKYAGKPVEVEKGSMIAFLSEPGRTPRPRLGGLNSLKTQKSLNLKFKSWKEMVDKFIGQLKAST